MRYRRGFVALVAGMFLAAGAPLIPFAPLAPAGAAPSPVFFEDDFDGSGLSSSTWNTSLETSGTR